jgi:hypothetical protein
MPSMPQKYQQMKTNGLRPPKKAEKPMPKMTKKKGK